MPRERDFNVPLGKGDPIAAIGKAQGSRMLQHGIIDHIVGIEENLIDSLVAEYRAGRLTEQKAIGTVGGFEALRRLTERLETEEQENLAVVEKEMQ